MNNRGFWLLTTVAFVLTWFVFIPYLASQDGVDLYERMASADRFTDSRGFNYSVDKVNTECMMAVYIAGSKVAAKHHTAPLDTPDRIYMQCMHAAGVLI